MLGPKLRKQPTKALSEVGRVRRSPLLLEDDGGVPILQLNPWHDLFTQEMEINGHVDLHSHLNEDQGRHLAVRGDPSPNHDKSRFLTLEVAQHVDPEAVFAGSKHSVVVDVVHGLHGEKLFIHPQDPRGRAIKQDFQDCSKRLALVSSARASQRCFL